MKSRALRIILIVFFSVALTGCTIILQSGRRSDVQKIEELSGKLDELNQTKRLLEQRLSEEIQGKQVRLAMMEKGLVITVVGDLLFDSGKANIRHEAYPLLSKVARVLKENVPELNVGIEGYTDNQPIKFSPWKTNWRLSSERALSVLEYLVDKEGVAPERLSAIGYGEYHPVASNDTKEGRQLNRRVEIVILPQLAKSKETKGAAVAQPLGESSENLK